MRSDAADVKPTHSRHKSGDGSGSFVEGEDDEEIKQVAAAFMRAAEREERLEEKERLPVSDERFTQSLSSLNSARSQSSATSSFRPTPVQLKKLKKFFAIDADELKVPSFSCSSLCLTVSHG